MPIFTNIYDWISGSKKKKFDARFVRSGRRGLAEQTALICVRLQMRIIDLGWFHPRTNAAYWGLISAFQRLSTNGPSWTTGTASFDIDDS